jgi:hypothetical protein
MLKRVGLGLERIQHRSQHRYIALDVLDAAFAKRRARGKKACVTGAIVASVRRHDAASVKSATRWSKGG